jgi:hypothetical protein
MRASQMNAAAVRTAGRYLGVWVAIALCVGLVSFAFTFLGTITSAVLVGMMMGALKGAKWFAFLVSLMFPAVIFGMTRDARTELTPNQIFLLAGLCFGTFWVTYLVSAVMFFCEQKGRKSSTTAMRASLPETAAAEPPAPLELAGESCLEQLQGDWVCEVSSAGDPPRRKVIQIKQAMLELKAVDVSGRTTVLARGEVTLRGLQTSAATSH